MVVVAKFRLTECGPRLISTTAFVFVSAGMTFCCLLKYAVRNGFHSLGESVYGRQQLQYLVLLLTERFLHSVDICVSLQILSGSIFSNQMSIGFIKALSTEDILG